MLKIVLLGIFKKDFIFPSFSRETNMFWFIKTDSRPILVLGFVNWSTVKVLMEIARKLGKKDWDFGKDPCTGEGNWKLSTGWKSAESSVSCECSFNNNSTCHIVSMYGSLHSFKSQSSSRVSIFFLLFFLVKWY